MPMNRRDLLVGGLATAVAGCAPTGPDPSETPSPAREPSLAPPEPAETLDQQLFPFGVVVAEVTGGSALIRVRAVDVERCELVVSRAENGTWVELGRPQLVRQGFTCPYVLDDLDGDTVYAVYARRGTRRSRVTRFRTAPTNRPTRRIRFGATSCLGAFNFHMTNLSFVAEHDPDLFLLLGDTVYADGSETLEEFEEVWTAYMSRPAACDMVASTGLLSVWDDHEVDNNWTLEPDRQGTVSEQTLRAAITTMEAVVPQRRGPDGRWRSHRWGDDLEFFLLDCRGERNEDGMVSEDQLAWLERELPASTARVKVVLSSVHVTDHFPLIGTIQEDDRWQGHPAQRARLVSLLASVPGTFVITGDMHFGSVQTLDAEGAGAEVLEVAAGPSGSRHLPVDGILDLLGEVPPQYRVVLEEWNWCLFDVDPATGEVSVQFIGDTGEVLAAYGFTV